MQVPSWPHAQRMCCSLGLAHAEDCPCQTAPQWPNNDNNNILYSSQREIKAVVRWHNEERISVILSHETHAYTLLLLDIRPLSLNLHTLIANPKLPGILLSLSDQNVTTLKLNKNQYI